MAECPSVVNEEVYLENCVTDMCSCHKHEKDENKDSSCMCPSLAAYGDDCVQNGIQTEWRKEVSMCSKCVLEFLYT